MSLFTVFVTKTEISSIQVEADSHEDAVNLASCMYADYNPVDIEYDPSYFRHHIELNWDAAYNDDEYEA